ncbi:EamA family transporter [Eupransor demetentiae]|uniref:Permease of the drug/metabolite transporter (DMT) superfamily (RhaT) n=1 Tax=Eupransor demetentiae TaxID=3109584 RepID=A0ABP0EUE4_9LACO|nr:Permease of the drug/metabolite transporter (DMT) superfamily (RhaT) [Lactobacillaceae bacterium LMG 33000]
MDSKTKKGLLIAISGAACWGASGTVAEYLFAATKIQPMWLVTVRLLVAGLLLLLLAKLRKIDVFAVWRRPRSAVQLLLFALLGMLPSQSAYFMAVKTGNAPTATVIQFLGPIFIILYLSVSRKVVPTKPDALSVGLAVLGTFFLVTGGHLDKLALSSSAILWGVAAGLAQASYTLLPGKLLKDYDEMTIVGWGMLLAGIPLSGNLGWTALPQFNVSSYLGIAFIIIFGTMVAYFFYLLSLRYLKPSTTGMLSSFEPLTATFLSVLFLGVTFNWVQALGIGLIISTVFISSRTSK